MIKRLKDGKYLRRLLWIEVAIFAIVAVISRLLGTDYASMLFLSGFLVIVMAFMGSSPVSRLNHPGGLGSDTMEAQMIRDFNEVDQISRLQGMMSDIVIIGLIPPFVAILMIVVL